MAAPDIVVLDVSCESHEKLVECLSEANFEYAMRSFGNDPSYAIYRKV